MAPSQISKIGPKFVRKFYARNYIEVKDANLEQSCPNKKNYNYKENYTTIDNVLYTIKNSRVITCFVG